MKLSLAFLGAALANERTISPLERLENIRSGVTDWCYTWIPQDNRKTRISSNLSKLIGRMESQFELECAILVPPGAEASRMDQVMTPFY